MGDYHPEPWLWADGCAFAAFHYANRTKREDGIYLTGRFGDNFPTIFRQAIGAEAGCPALKRTVRKVMMVKMPIWKWLHLLTRCLRGPSL